MEAHGGFCIAPSALWGLEGWRTWACIAPASELAGDDSDPGWYISRLQRSGVWMGAYLGLHRPGQRAGRDDSDPGWYISRLQRLGAWPPELIGHLPMEPITGVAGPSWKTKQMRGLFPFAGSGSE